MRQTDFTTALGRLLRDGTLRDEFARNPQAVAVSLGVRPEDAAAFSNLNAADLETQARVLLRKRFDAMQRWLPRTCAALGSDAWNCFHRLARTRWPDEKTRELQDAVMLLKALLTEHPGHVVRSERNRLQFAFSPVCLRLHLVRDLWIREKRRAGLQIFLQWNRSRWREQALFFSL